jgi:calcineurin-like phosphoesterase family protein
MVTIGDIMATTWLISDTHFGHENCCTKFKRADGSPLRPFSCAEEMDEEMVKRWNERVKPNDKVYHLGDVVIAKRHLATLGRLNGDKVLIKGNHDIFKLEDYTRYFRDIRGYHVLNGMILSHIPVHESNLYRFGTNIHGHLHDNRVMTFSAYRANGMDKIDPNYYSVCVEQTNFAPISLEEVKENIIKQGGVVGFKNGNGPTM